MDKADRKEQQAGEQKQQVFARRKADPVLNLIPSRATRNTLCRPGRGR